MPYVCPWWAVPFTIDPPFRRFLHEPTEDCRAIHQARHDGVGGGLWCRLLFDSDGEDGWL